MIIIGADFVPSMINENEFIKGDLERLFDKELVSVIQKADYRIFNLEIPLVTEKHPIKKWGPNLSAPKECINLYRNLNVNLLTLANNHIMDQGEEGLSDTISIIEQNGIDYLGVGHSIADVKKTMMFTFGKLKIGVYACVEHEFSIAGENLSGANPFDPYYSFDEVQELKLKCDRVIVLYHGGKELYRYPSPLLQKTCRRFVEKGADLVICQHSHCIGCEEKYLKARIIYGQGNFLFNKYDNEWWNTGLLVGVSEDFNICYIPVVKNNKGIRAATETEKKDILASFHERSCEIQNYGFVEKKYEEFALASVDKYLTMISGKETKVFRVLNKILRNNLRKISLKKRYRNSQILGVRNYIECESHRELFVKGLERIDYE